MRPGGQDDCYLDLAAVHSAEEPTMVKPLPLQAFWPLQALVADLQALWPLQALAPGHWTSARAAAVKVLTANTAAAVATRVRLVMTKLSLDVDAGGDTPPRQATLHAVYAA